MSKMKDPILAADKFFERVSQLEQPKKKRNRIPISKIKRQGREMEKQGKEQWEIAQMFKTEIEKCGIKLSDDFVKYPDCEQMTQESE